MDVSLLAGGLVLGAILLMLALDLLLHRDAHVISVREAATRSGVWVATGIAAGATIWALYGAEIGQQYFAGYLIETSLEVDILYIPTAISLAVITTIITVSIVLSLRATRGQGRRAPAVEAGPFAVSDEEGRPLGLGAEPEPLAERGLRS